MRLAIQKDGKTIKEFELTERQLQMAEELGIPQEKYIIEYAKLVLEEEEKNENTRG